MANSNCRIEPEYKPSENEARYKLLLEYCPEPIAVHYEGKYLYVNLSAARLFGFSNPQDMIGRKVDETIHPTYSQLVSNRINSLVKGKKAINLQFNRIITVTGETRDIEVIAIPFEYKGNIAVQAIFRDVTERNRIKNIMRENEEKFKLIFNNVNDVILLTKVIGDNLFENLLDANEVAWRKLGLTKQEFKNRYLQKLIDRKDYIRLQPIIKDLLKGKSVTYKVKAITRDGKRIPFECNSRLFLLDNKQVILTTARDMSDRKAAKAKLKTSYAKLKKINNELTKRRQYKMEFLANMSHEFRTPLTAILALSNELLEEKVGSLTDKQEKYLKDIIDSGNNLYSLVNDLLDLSKIESGKMELDLMQVQVGVIARYIRDKLLPVARVKDVELHLYIEGQNTVICDARKIRQVISNLVDNAIKFNPPKSFVEIKVFEITTPKAGTVIAVSDNGPGISTENQELVFDAFYQVSKGLNKLFRGTGLGLALAKKIVELHTGYIDVLSQQGKGSTFRVFLPAYPELEPDFE